MARVNICDATGEVIPEGDEVVAGWGRKRVYGCTGAEAFAEYEAAVREATVAAKKVFDKKKEAARNAFLKRFPNGKLPDDEDEDEPQQAGKLQELRQAGL